MDLLPGTEEPLGPCSLTDRQEGAPPRARARFTEEGNAAAGVSRVLGAR